ncbi:MAG: RHS repeat-associated core domain-containing protein [Betaproteobacteria bacterium]|nr:RHS repeat-associated core domain-containing protein [Betaproteobacteria bacterium]
MRGHKFVVTTHYNYFRDYEPGIGRYVQSDPIGLKGGNSTYSYVGQRPISARDPYGLVKWEGSGFSGSMGLGLGGGMESYTLVSECKCGKRVTVGVAVMYGVVGKGPIPISGSAGGTCFIDGLGCPSAKAAEGLFVKSSLSAVYGYGGALGITRLGQLTSCSLFSDSWGMDIGFNVVGIGYSKVTFAIEERCDGCGP